jgi:undecaprenyl-diphosphatase
LIDFELKILDALQNTHFPPLDFIMIFLSNLAEWGVFFIFLTLLMLTSRKTRRVGFVCATSLILSYLIVDISLKPIIARARPFAINTAARLIYSPPPSFSFPSGHSSISFAFAASIKPLGKKWSRSAYILASLIAFSRLYLYVHFPTDVLFGILIGFFIGIFSRYLWRRKLYY